MGLLSKEEILNADDLKRATISVPEWGGEVCIGEMTGTVRDAYERELFAMRGENVEMKELRLKMVRASVIDPETGELMFDHTSMAALGAKSWRALERVYDAAEELNAMSKAAVEQTAKNS